MFSSSRNLRESVSDMYSYVGIGNFVFAIVLIVKRLETSYKQLFLLLSDWKVRIRNVVG